ncbi:Flowering time control protein FPA [Sesamum alatum]|uniref:Flowering time control protein FPA n=1 Tax=Sesamum alatum TaxID=300844 RepID=A0AAE1Y873_9LAMI|nr:Flowering time control protein FPA [Sesamum alatum]
MAPPVKSAANPTLSGGAYPPRENPPSNNLWIGNLSPDVSNTELKALFEKHGKVDSVISYPSRNYAFIYFKEIDGAASAKQGLQGQVLRGNPLRIEFAKPAKPCKSLWVAGLSQSVSKEELEEKFARFGKIEEFRFLRDRNTAYVDYFNLEDATQALKSMNGKRIGGAQIRVDFLRSQSSRREPDAKEGQFPSRNMGTSDFRWMGQDSLSSYPEPSLSGSKRKSLPGKSAVCQKWILRLIICITKSVHLRFPSGVCCSNFFSMGSQMGDAPPSKVLWISHPPSVIIEEDMLHNAMILFGEIERIKTFSDRNYAFVEFRSIEEARRAKEGLQGKLFNDPRISIEYSSSEFPGARAQAGEYPFQPVQMDILGLNRPVILSNNPARPSLGVRGSDLYMRQSLGPHSTFEPALHGPDLMDLASVHKLQNPSTQSLMGGPTWRRSSPTPVIVSSPSAGFGVPNRSASGAWDSFDSNQLQRESKRSRFDTALLTEDQGGLDEQYGLRPLSSGIASGSLIRGTTGGPGQRHSESDCIWRGLIAKGGTPVCRARCVPIGEGLGADIPDVVNCSARTGLDLLSKHYDDAIGFDIVFFLPDSEDDFASYTEFLRYLGSKDRAGVAKFDDGTTLFLVPPSEFLTRVLKVSGPERLYGVVLKFPQAAPTSTTMIPRPSHPHADPHKMTSLHAGYSASPPEERVLPLDNSRVLPEDPKLPPKASYPVTSSLPAHSIPPTTVASQASLALTPELIATLTALLPANNGSGSQTASLPQTPSMLGARSNVAAGPDTNVALWKHELQALDHNGQLVQQLGGQINSQLQHLQVAQSAPTAPNSTGYFPQTLNSYGQIHDRPMNLTPQGAASSKPMAPSIPLQSGSVSVPLEINQHYQPGSSQDVLRGQGMDNGADGLRFYNSSNAQQPVYPVALSNQVQVNGVSPPQPYMPQPSQVDVTHQSQPPQTAPFGGGQESAETEADKNERYKTTLLFAANLLSRIHQPSGNQPGQGAGSH